MNLFNNLLNSEETPENRESAAGQTGQTTRQAPERHSRRASLHGPHHRLRPDAEQMEFDSAESQVAPASARHESLGATPVTRLLRGFQDESGRYRRRLRGAIRLVIGGAVTVTLVNAFAVLIAARQGAQTLPFAFLLASWLLYGLILCAAPIGVFKARVARDRLRDRLAGYDDIRVIGPLAEMLQAPDPALHGAASEALIRLLPRLRRADAPLLNAEQRDSLCSVLRANRREETDLAIAILDAFAAVGESDVLTLVERLAEMTGRTRRQRAVRAAALATLPTLKEHVEQARASGTLLRPSDGCSSPDTLLRPVSQTAPSDPQSLLRPASPSNSEEDRPNAQAPGTDAPPHRELS
jgi:hypothetical protein